MISFFYHLEDTDHGSINRYLSGLVGKSLMELEMSYCLEVGEDNRTITPLTLGRIASYYYLKHGTMRMFRDSLSQHCTIPELIDVLSNASEFAELPVRHNEDQLNGDLANQIPLEVNRSSLDSSHTKTNILLQAYFSRLTLPSSDFQTDTKSVLDQAIRVLQAMLDVSADEGWLVTSLNIIMLIQMVVQGRWWNDSTLLTLPHMQTYHVSCLRSMGGKRDNRNFSSVHGPIESLPQLMDICDGKHHVLNSLFDGIMEQQQIDQVCQVLVSLPQIEVKVEVKGWLARVGQDRTKEVDITYSGGVRPESCWLPVHADQEYVFHITLRRINRSKKTDSKAHTLSFPKPKDEGWIIVIGNIETREVIALKRVGFVRGRTTANISVYTPQVMGRVIYTVYLMSDAYLGLDQQYDVCFDVLEANIEAQVNAEMCVLIVVLTFLFSSDWLMTVSPFLHLYSAQLILVNRLNYINLLQICYFCYMFYLDIFN
ncbi:activating signal cointegrator 1 complex subunit [Bulinus truncatus]|nr:activating signal cointegrator 1 complex subunit [Bulinus truncatus]